MQYSIYTCEAFTYTRNLWFAHDGSFSNVCSLVHAELTSGFRQHVVVKDALLGALTVTLVVISLYIFHAATKNDDEYKITTL